MKSCLAAPYRKGMGPFFLQQSQKPLVGAFPRAGVCGGVASHRLGSGDDRTGFLHGGKRPAGNQLGGQVAEHRGLHRPGFYRTVGGAGRHPAQQAVFHAAAQHMNSGIAFFRAGSNLF